MYLLKQMLNRFWIGLLLLIVIVCSLSSLYFRTYKRRGLSNYDYQDRKNCNCNKEQKLILGLTFVSDFLSEYSTEPIANDPNEDL